MRCLVLIGFFVIAISCTKELNYELQDETRIVVNSLLKPNEPISLNLSTTTSVLGTYNDSLRTYHVRLSAAGNLLIDTVTGSGLFATNIDWDVKTNYRIEVESEDLPSVWVEDSIPPIVFIQESKYFPSVGVDEYGDKYSRISVTFTDPQDYENYYELIIQNGESSYWYYADGGTDLPVIDPVLQNEGDMSYYPSTYFFSDELFNGQTYTIRINGHGSYQLKARLRSVSKNYYLYQKYYTRHVYNQQFRGDFWETVFMSEPQSMYTNVKNGYGIFAGYTEHVIEVE
jgi:hypothetical protein